MKVAVTELAHFIHRRGDIHFRYDRYVAPSDGIKAQRKLQSSRAEGYSREVALSLDVEGEPAITVSGRADGVDLTGAVPMIEEIKATRTDLDALHAHGGSAHWAQALIYGYLYAREHGCDHMCVRLIYVHIDTLEERVHERVCDIDTLQRFFDDTVNEYRRWAAKEAARAGERDRALAALEFPQRQYRAGQRRLAEAVYRAVQVGGTLLAEAPTGIGKTLGTLFPALKALGRGRAQRILFLTAKGTGAGAAKRTLDTLREGARPLRWVELTAKAKICFNPDRACDPDQCSYARGYYDRVRPALETLLERGRLCRDTVAEAARAYHVCPFELSLEASRWCDVVVADVNYVFDPIVTVLRLREVLSESVLLIDEAHHLPERGREMFSAELSEAQIGQAQTGADAELGKAVMQLRGCLRELGSADPPEALAQPPSALMASVVRFNRQLEHLWERHGTADASLTELGRATWRFERSLEWFAPERFSCVVGADGGARVRLHCIDPAPMLGKRIAEAGASVLFSATLAPLDYFRAELDIGEAPALQLASPFPADNLCALMVTDVSTRWRERAASIHRVATLIGDVARMRAGNYLVFFPSYAYLGAAREELARVFPELEVDVEKPGMDANERVEFLGRFETGRTRPRVALAVMAGSFGESIDLAGERLIGVIVVGVGLPPPSVERDLLQWHHRARRGESAVGRADGYDVAYRYPGIVRVLQNAGRLIRSDADRGVLVLVDSRYRWRQYRSLLPEHWQVKEVSNETVGAAVSEFWS